MPYCHKCGNQLSENDKFCFSCGTKVASDSKADNNNRKEESVETAEKARQLTKCPRCGELLESFAAVCPACGFELRNIAATSSLVDFQTKYMALSKTKQKLDLVRSFPVPNDKESILDFMIMAVSNVNPEATTEPELKLSNAWGAKVEQTYEKGKLVLDDPSGVENMYLKYLDKKQDRETQEKKQQKKKFWSQWGPVVIGCGILFLMGSIGMGFGMCSHSKIASDELQRVQEEDIQLSELQAKAEREIAEGDYTAARMTASQIVADASKANREKWDTIRFSLIDTIDEKEGIVRIRVNMSSDSLEGVNYKDAVEQLKQRGFTNILTKPQNDIVGSLAFYTEDSVASVSIGGRTSFKATDSFPADAEIIVKYHSKSALFD